MDLLQTYQYHSKTFSIVTSRLGFREFNIEVFDNTEEGRPCVFSEDIYVEGHDLFMEVRYTFEKLKTRFIFDYEHILRYSRILILRK